MNLTYEQLGAIFRLCVYMMQADGEITSKEVVPFRRFLYRFDGMDQEILNEIMRVGQYEVTDERALQLIAGLDDDTKREVADLLADTVVSDGQYSEKEEELLDALVESCGLPAPVIEGYGEDKIPPTFIAVKTSGLIEIWQTETNEWSEVEGALCEAVGAERLEVVRFTPILNQLTEALGLNGRHLVFLMDRNAAMKEDVCDNMTGTILYGRGYEIMGDIVLALETDEGYDVVGMESFKKECAVFDAVNDAVGGLMRIPE